MPPEPPSPFPPPRPPAGSLEEEFWSFARRGDLRFQRCAGCGTWRHPPSPICPACQSEHFAWAAAPDAAELFSWTIVHHPMHPAAAAAVPYVVVLADFPAIGVRFAANLVGPPGALVVGQGLRLVWRDGVDGDVVPAFAVGHGR